jgi:Phosphotransferase enzyme family
VEHEGWIRTHVEPAGAIELVHEEAWATVLRVPLADGSAWFKACGPVQAFEPRLSAELAARHPGLVADVLAYDEERAWLLLADAGTPVGVYGNPPEPWLEVLPGYAELQRGETSHAHEQLAYGVPDLRVAELPALYEDLVARDLPLDADELEALRRFAPRFDELCRELAGHGVPETIQHDDLHHMNVFADGDRLRVLDWGDSSISHPFASLVVTFRFLEEITKLPLGDPWFARLRDAYLEPWGSGLEATFDLAYRVGAVAHTFKELRVRDQLREEDLPEFDRYFPLILRRAISIMSM